MNSVENMPWVSILTQVYQQKDTRGKNLLVQMLAKVTLQAFSAYNNGSFHELDALVGNNGCESHAFNILVLAHSQDLQNEIRILQPTIEAIGNRILGKKTVGAPSIDDIEGIMVSKNMSYLIQSRMLTITKAGEKTNPHLLAGRALNKLQSEVGKIVMASQVAMSRLSFELLHAQLEQMHLGSGLVHQIMDDLKEFTPILGRDPKVYSSCYFTTKAVVLLSATLQAPLVLKSMTKEKGQEETVLFTPTETQGVYVVQETVDPKRPVILCDTLMSADLSWIRNEVNLGELLLIDAAHEECQFVPRHPEIVISDPEALTELLAAKPKTAPFHIDHFYCTTWGAISCNK